MINLLRHIQKVNRERDGAVQFYKIKFLIRDYSLSTQNWSDNRWLACLAAGGGPKRRYQYCPDYLGSIIYLRALQGHSGNNIIDLEMQDHVLITPGIFTYIYHVGSNFKYSFNSQQRIDTWRSRIKREDNLYFFLPVDPRDENHRDPDNIDYSVPRRAQYKQKQLEKAPGYGILDRYWSWNHQRTIKVLSNKIECNYPSRCTSTKLRSESWKIERRRTIV